MKKNNVEIYDMLKELLQLAEEAKYIPTKVVAEEVRKIMNKMVSSKETKNVK